jgi:protein tyrosine phosphatase type IVA
MTQNLHSAIIITHSVLKNFTFILSDCPAPAALPSFITTLASHACHDLVRISAIDSYDPNVLISAGISIHEMQFVDGSVPPPDLVKKYFDLIDKLLANNTNILAIHCVSGIGRAPLLIAMVLIRSGMDRMDAIEFMRSKRRGAINKIQLDWILSKKGFQIPKKSGGIMSKLFGR